MRIDMRRLFHAGLLFLAAIVATDPSLCASDPPDLPARKKSSDAPGAPARGAPPATVAAPATAPSTAAVAVRAADYGTVISVDAGVIRFVQWGEKADAAKVIGTSADTS